MVVDHYSGLTGFTSQKSLSNSTPKARTNDAHKELRRDLVMLHSRRIKQYANVRPFNKVLYWRTQGKVKGMRRVEMMLSRSHPQLSQYFLVSRFLCSLLYGAFEKHMAALRSQLQMKASQGVFSSGKEQEERTEPR